MKVGSLNEKPAAEAFRNPDEVEAMCDVGLLCPHKFHSTIAVSPDGTAVHKKASGQLERWTVEIKTRVGEVAMLKAIEVRDKFGSVIECECAGR